MNDYTFLAEKSSAFLAPVAEMHQSFSTHQMSNSGALSLLPLRRSSIWKTHSRQNEWNRSENLP